MLITVHAQRTAPTWQHDLHVRIYILHDAHHRYFADHLNHAHHTDNVNHLNHADNKYHADNLDHATHVDHVDNINHTDHAAHTDHTNRAANIYHADHRLTDIFLRRVLSGYIPGFLELPLGHRLLLLLAAGSLFALFI